MPSIEPKGEAARLRTLYKVLVLRGEKRPAANLVIIMQPAGSMHWVKHSLVDNSIHSQGDRVCGEDMLGRNLIHLCGCQYDGSENIGVFILFITFI